MDKEVILQLVSEAYDIGESNSHYVDICVNTNKKGFIVSVYIHFIAVGLSAGIDDSRFFCTNSDYYLNRHWIQKWRDIIQAERDKDDTNRY